MNRLPFQGNLKLGFCGKGFLGLYFIIQHRFMLNFGDCICVERIPTVLKGVNLDNVNSL